MYRITNGRTGKVTEGTLVYLSSSMDMTGADKWFIRLDNGETAIVYVDEGIDTVEYLG